MKKNILIMFFFAFISSQNNSDINREFIYNGDFSASLIENEIYENLHLVQIDAVNDSLLQIVELALPDLELYGGVASYHRIITPEQYSLLSSVLTNHYLKLIDSDYNPSNITRDYWVQTIYGSDYYGSTGEIGNTCSCLDASNCVVVGFNDSWYNPFDYYGEAWWNFSGPAYDDISEVRVYVQGAQCDLLPLTSETNVSIRGNDCSWNGNFQASLSIDYTLNGPFIIPSDQLDQIWCDGNLQPVIGSEDNYTVDFVRMEVYYTCDEPNGVSDLVASSNQFCDHVQLSWNSDLSDQYNLYRDGELFMQLSNSVIQYQDYQAIQGETHQYCIESINNCGNSEFICTYGSRKNVPNPVGFINASDGEFQDYIQIEWEEVNDNLTYKLFRDGVQLSVIGANQETLYVDQFVEPEIIYDYCVLAENDCGESNLSCDEGFLAIGSIGDVNLDQEVDVLDIVLLLNFIIEVQTPSEDQLWLSDINSDNNLNILDIVALVSIILR